MKKSQINVSVNGHSPQNNARKFLKLKQCDNTKVYLSKGNPPSCLASVS